jgi:hypothetical protein
MKKSGYFEEDLIREVVKKPKKCVHCKAVVVDAPRLPDGNINLNSSQKTQRRWQKHI